MNREIKFRTPHKCQNGHFRWAYWKVKFGDMTSFTWGEKHPECNCPTHAIGEGFGEIGGDEQFTGLKDKNGVEIYEGDIMENPTQENDPIVGTIVFSHGSFGFETPIFKQWYPISELQEELDLLVIIGNIYENPELIP